MLALLCCLVVVPAAHGFVASGERWPERTIGLVLAETATRIIRDRPLIKATLIGARLLPPRLVYTLFKRRIMNPPRYGPVGPALRETPESRDERCGRFVAAHTNRQTAMTTSVQSAATRSSKRIPKPCAQPIGAVRRPLKR